MELLRKGLRPPSVVAMARMTPQEATAVNVLLGYMVGKDETPPREVVFALEILASRAFNRLQGGWSETSVRHQWPHAYEDPEVGGGEARK